VQRSQGGWQAWEVADQTTIKALPSHRKKRFLQNSLCRVRYPVRAIFYHILNHSTMVELFIWLAIFLCINPTQTHKNHDNCKQGHPTTVSTTDDTGGETGGNPRPPVPPPPPPPTGG